MSKGERLELWDGLWGNKTSKLECLAQDVVDKGCNRLVSIGGLQSNNTNRVAAVAPRLGLKAVLV